ncbi:hypothetical protein MOC86_06615, partial [Priestia endophytica]|nr:hypothetical protein [Priestia endophytica]
GVICMQIQEIEDKGKETKQPKQTPKKGSRAKKQEGSQPQEENKQEKKQILVPEGTKEWMSLEEIKVPETFLQFTPGIAKQKAVEESIEQNGTVDKPIIINPDTHELVDSYSRYFVAKKKNLDRVPVHY